ncbi:MAG: hypothetical protein BGP16_07525 [Sphingobium sp. 66-54]|nr:MAG: hypothetical protein BGP16_07525 [Sphingobium sp. 66-54]
MENGKAMLEIPGMEAERDKIAAAALAVLDEAGLEQCGAAAVSARLGVPQAVVERLFPAPEDLFGAMAQRIAADVPGATGGEGWHGRLAHRAVAGRQAMLSRRDGSRLFARLPLPLPLGDGTIDMLRDAGASVGQAEAALGLVDHLTLGAALAEQSGVVPADPQEAFERQLDLALRGIAAMLDARGPRDERRSNFQSRLWVFLRNARESANIAFARTVHINELDRRILLLLQARGDMTLAAISTSNGVDKAQVSRAIKRMSDVSLVTRGGIRSPIRLSQSGRHLAEKLLRQAELRNRELTFGVTDDQLVILFGVLDTLLSRAVALFEQERKRSAGSQRQTEQVDFQDLVNEGLPGDNGIAVDRSRLLPPFITLCSYMLRGGALAHKRRTGLSNFETWVMNEICRQPPISWPQLVLALYRDQSQAGRTVNQLIERGLVERSGRPGRRHGFFGPTEAGRQIHDILTETVATRSEFLFQGIDEDRLDTFMSAFDILFRNAEVQVAREKAIQEMDRD